MKVFINAVSARAGGGVSYLINLIEHLHQVAPSDQFVIAIPDIAILSKYSTNNNIEIIKVKEASGNLFSRYLWENTKLIKLCKTTKADILYCVANVIPLVNPGIPVVVMIQNVAPVTPKVRKALFKFEGLYKSLQMLLLQVLTLHSLKYATHSICLSNSSVKLLKKWYPKIKTSVLHHGIDMIFGSKTSKPLQAGKEDYFLYVSNLYVYKGVEYIVDALAYDRELPSVFIAGKIFDTSYINWVKERAKSKGVTDRIIFLDNIENRELPSWYSHANAVVFSSWCESISIILLEAMGCSCPVVGMDIGPIPEICGETGYLAKPFDGKSLAKAMRMSLESPNKLQKRELAKKRAKEFTWTKAIEDHVKVFKSIKLS